MTFPEKKKKQLSFKAVFFKLFSSRPILHSQIFSRPLKKGLHLKSISDSAIFPPTSGCSLKKKKKGLYVESISHSAIFAQKSRCSRNQRFPNCAPRKYAKVVVLTAFLTIIAVWRLLAATSLQRTIPIEDRFQTAWFWEENREKWGNGI